MKRLMQLLIGLSLVWTIACHGADVLRFRGENSQGIFNETGLLKSWPEEGLTPLWTYTGLGVGWSSVSKVGNRLFTTGTDAEDKSREITVCLDLNGKKLWQTVVGKVWQRAYQGARCTPTFVPKGVAGEDCVLVLSGGGDIFCLNAADGKVLWQKDIASTYQSRFGHWGMAESPVVKDGNVFVVAGGGKALVVALKIADGSVVWESKPNNDNCAYVTPALLGDQLIVMTATKVNGVDTKTGEILWESKYSEMAGPVRWGGINCNPPFVKGNRFFVTAGYNQGGVMYELNPDGKGVKVVWASKVLDPHHDGVVEVNGKLYGSNWENNNSGKWVCMDWDTGNVVYEQNWENLGKGSIQYADGMLYMYEERRGTVGLAKPGDKLDVVSKFPIRYGTKEHWAHPTISDGILYVRRGDALAAFDIRAK